MYRDIVSIEAKPMAAQQKYKIAGMDCIDCARTITNGVSKFPGVSNVAVDHIGGTLVFDGDVPLDQLKQRIEMLGYKMGDETAAPVASAPIENGLIAFA